MELQLVETPFKFDFSEETRIHEMAGYIQAMNEILKYLQDVTEWKPENRYIDSVPLGEKISATCKALQPLLSEELIKNLRSQLNPNL